MSALGIIGILIADLNDALACANGRLDAIARIIGQE